MNTANNPFVLRVFPNTGHQYAVLPLARLLPDWSPEALDDFVQANPGYWKAWDAFTPWVRYQFVRQMDGVEGPALKLAIETNLGAPHHGFLYDVEERDADSPSPENKDSNPYACYDEAHIEEDYGRERCIPLTYLPNEAGEEIEIEVVVHWVKATGSDPVDVDLVVDLGNTRTVALLLESPGQAQVPFGRRVQPVRFMPPGVPYAVQNFNGQGSSFDDLSIIDSWFVLHRPTFAGLGPPFGDDKIVSIDEDVPANGSAKDADNGTEGTRRVMKYVSNTFLEVSPALIGGGDSTGGARDVLAHVPLEEDARFALGSPKRYAWDDRPVGVCGTSHWSQIPDSSTGRSKLNQPFYFEQLDGLFRIFMDPEGFDWDVDSPPNENDLSGAPFRNSPPNYPRRDSICWFALSIIEAAYRQINSDSYLNLAKRRTLPRRLARLSVLYPAGWTTEERECYFKQWRRALNIFALTHLRSTRPVSFHSAVEGGQRPVFEERVLDEAMCAQLPVIYTDVSVLGDCGRGWLDLYGDGSRVKVMNLDIGGGTSDLAVIEYERDKPADEDRTGNRSADPSARLKAKLLYKDGVGVAGDALVKKIIEKVLIPRWLEESDDALMGLLPEALPWIRKMFLEPESIVFSNVDPRLPGKLARAMRLVYLPIVNHLLHRLGSDSDGREWEPVAVGKLADRETLSSLNHLLATMLGNKLHGDLGNSCDEVFREAAEVSCPRQALEDCVDEVFGDFFESLAGLFERFPCDLLILSGKPSELSRIRQFLEETLPILPYRIIRLKGYAAGNWYPFSDEGRVTDAKTAAVVGAALHQDILNGNLQGFSVRGESTLSSTPHYWGCITEHTHAGEFFDNLLFDPREIGATSGAVKEFSLPLNCLIGRQLFRDSGCQPEPVYELVYDGPMEPNMFPVAVKVKLRWFFDESTGERLELVEARVVEDGLDMDSGKISLKLRTLLEESHWLDAPKIDFAAGSVRLDEREHELQVVKKSESEMAS